MSNKSVFSKNLQYQMDLHKKSRRDVCAALGFSYFTFSDWVTGKKYPRMDKVEMLANYFGILKSDLIEERTDEHREMQKNNDAISDIVLQMREDNEFLSIVLKISKLDPEKRKGLSALLD